MNNLWLRFIAWLSLRMHDRHIYTRKPDITIGGKDHPYLERWWIIPRNRVFNIYLQQFWRSDDDRALHDHPWAFNVSILLAGRYIEHTIERGGIHRAIWRAAGAIKVRFGRSPHRLELFDMGKPCVTLFITGPVVRHWGFHCPRGWVGWKDFTTNGGTETGKGCDQ